jgi:hypothetical protein
MPIRVRREGDFDALERDFFAAEGNAAADTGFILAHNFDFSLDFIGS